jgi:hypothetical protein
LRLICDHGRIPTEELGRRLVSARPSSTNPGFAPTNARTTAALTWRLEAQGFIAEGEDEWTTTANGRRLISCSGAPV